MRLWPRSPGGRGVLLGAGSLLLLLAGASLWLLLTQAGARFALARAEGLLAPRLSVGALRGTLAGPLHVEALRWRDPATGVDVTLAAAEVDLALRSLAVGTVHVTRMALSELRVELTPVPPEPSPPRSRDPLEPPVDIIVDDFTLRYARIVASGEELVHVREAAVTGAWTAQSLFVRRLDVQANQGELHFTGTAAGRDQYRGTGSGRFAWNFGERRVAGTLEARAAGADANLELRLSEPAAARLTLGLQQQRRLPWQFTLDLPAMDPREALLPGSSLRQVAAQLQGEGTLDEAVTRGRVLLNDTPVEIRSLQARRAGDAIALVGDVGFGGGEVALAGTLRTAPAPLAGEFTVQWQGIAIPADLAGQELRTAGRLALGGTLEAYTARGGLQVGPPGRLANIQLNLNGTPRDVQLARLDIVQPQGRLAAGGRVQLQPEVRWTIGAAATAFDPGALLSDWPGRLDFSLGTTGRITPAGPEALVALQNLSGRLRGRQIRGAAELQLGADRILTGTADVASGASRVRLDATRNGDGEAHAVARVEVASLADWLPDARGSLQGRIDAQGRWPELRITAQLRGSGLEYDANVVRTAQLDLDITHPLQPAGRVSLDAEDAGVAGFEFATLALRAEGDQARHSGRFDATGTRLTLGVDVAGGLDQGAWTGSVTRLQVAVPDAARLALEAPFAVTASAQGATLGRACLADGEIRVCAEGVSGPAPALHARYSLHAVPLRLVQSFVVLPLGVEGTLDGDGDLRRDPQGSVSGTAHLRSPAGRLTEAVVGDEMPRELLAWSDLALDADLQGESAQLTGRATLNDSGSLEARFAASALRGADPQVQGTLTARLPGLGVVEAFTPQLMNVQGTLALQAQISGSLDAPRIEGEARASGLGFDLPALGLKPRDGEVLARMNGDGPIALEGGLRSGEGELRFTGQGRLTGEADVKVTGTNVLAADIPGIRVTLAPDLTVRRTPERTDLQGAIRIPSASVDLQRLPSARRARSASPDVVVVDDAEALARDARSAPLHARVAVTFGDDVKIKGYGLDASVGGELDIRERPGEATTASGELRVAGKYQAYGQDLTIQQGQLLFASTPIDNPRLAIVAVRQVDTVTAGFRVAGNARAPELTVFSDPAMGQASALSYIVAGKPLDQIGQGSGEGDALQLAARQLGTAAGGLLAKNVGRRLGVDELGIKDSASIGGAALTVGQYLSPRLYLGYGVGLFAPGQVVTLRYRLSREVSLEAEQGTLNSRAGIEFRKER